jgi:hypothetical protein
MTEENRSIPNTTTKDGTPCLAKVISIVDQTYNGVLEVQLMREVGSNEKSGSQIRQVKYLSPFYGVTSYDYLGQDPDVHNETQKSYGFWMIPPDVGSFVVVIFLNGDEKKGYWIGCPMINENMNFSTPGFAATKYISDISRQTDREKERVPGTEYNKKIHEGNEDGTKKLKPEHPFARFLEKQGLLKDDTRGITTSSARREVPSMVFGISTPGPIDKGGKTGKVGKAESEINNAFVSRLGGSSIVMDDGDDKWEREKLPSDGPPDYKNVEENETGLRDRPHNELLRFRTRTGHQILLHNSEDLIYICNSRGTAWIELTSDGKIDIFAADSINVRTKQDFNFRCDRDFNLDVGRNFNIKVGCEMHTRVCKDYVLRVDENQKIEIAKLVDETIGGEYRQNVIGHVKKVYNDDYTHNILGRMDLRVLKGTSASFGVDSGPLYAPYRPRSDDPDDPCANDDDRSIPIKDVHGPTPDRVDIIVNKDLRIHHVNGHSVDQHIEGYLKTKVDGSVDINTDSSWKHTSGGDIDIKAGGHIFNTSGGSNETLAGGNIIETAPQIHMNGPQAGTAPTADIAEEPEEARISALATLQHYLAENILPDLPSQDDWQNLQDLVILPRRAPTFEPYPQHENLGPLEAKPDKLMRDVEYRYDPPDDKDFRAPFSAWRKYSTNIDTFTRNPPVEPSQDDEGLWGL